MLCVPDNILEHMVIFLKQYMRTRTRTRIIDDKINKHITQCIAFTPFDTIKHCKYILKYIFQYI